MNATKALLVLNGEAPAVLPDTSNYDLVCAADGALAVLQKFNIIPDFISGDFDSIEKIPSHIESIETPDQDFTDFDKILQILETKGITNIDVFGASGKEQDHFLGNLHSALQWKKKLRLTFFDHYGYYFLAENQVKLDQCLDKTISLFPFPVAKNITTKGLKFSLNNEDLKFGVRIGTRNKAISDKIEIEFTSGNLFIFINHENK